MAGELGFEPRLTVSETAVLPLNDSPKDPEQTTNCMKILSFRAFHRSGRRRQPERQLAGSDGA